MPRSSKSPLLVAKFAIEGVGQGADQPHLTGSVPPRLPGPHTASFPVLSVSSFPINPFSLSRSSSHNSHTCISVSQSPVLNVHNSVLPPASVPFVSSSSHARSLFPNPFLLERTSDSQPAPFSAATVTTSHATDSHNSSTSRTVVQRAQCLNALPIPSPPAATITSMSTRKSRRPQADRILTSSLLRPRVMAVDRLFSWRTPYGLSHDESLRAELPPDLVESAKMSITGALAMSSRSTYAAGLLRFSQFCDRWGISEGARMPASYALLCAFIGNYKGSTSGKTIKSWLSGIRAWHLANHAPWYGDDKWVQMARISANKEGSRHKRPLRAPVSIEHLLALRKAITLSNNFHAAVWAVALITFFGCRRLGETTVASASSFDPCLHVLRSAEYVCPCWQNLMSSLTIFFQNCIHQLARRLTFRIVPHTMDKDYSRGGSLHHCHRP
jgi:hypothetical protein